MPSNIAIIGTRGAGKTVFVTVLAKYLSTPKNGVLLIPDSYDIDEYVEVNYATLQRGRWLDSTNTEQMLSWKLRLPGKREDRRLTLLDCPGEDIQRLFARKDFEGDKASGRDRMLVDYLLGASVVLLLINLQDFLDDSYEEESVRARKQREYTLKEFLSAIKKDTSRQVAVVFTAYNQYRERIKNEHIDVNHFLANKLPSLYYEHFREPGFPGFPVSAVADTDQGNNPKPGFAHQGLDRLIEWIVDPVQFVRDRDARYQQRQARQEQNHPVQQQEEQKDVGRPRMYDW